MYDVNGGRIPPQPVERREHSDARPNVRYQDGGSMAKGSCCGGDPPDVPVRYDLRIVRGATWALGVQAVDTFGRNIIMPEGGVLRLAISPHRGEPFIKEFGAAEQGDDGFITMALLPRETWALPNGKHPYSAVLLYSDLERVPALCGAVEVYDCDMPEPPEPDGSGAEDG